MDEGPERDSQLGTIHEGKVKAPIRIFFQPGLHSQSKPKTPLEAMHLPSPQSTNSHMGSAHIFQQQPTNVNQPEPISHDLLFQIDYCIFTLG